MKACGVDLVCETAEADLAAYRLKMPGDCFGATDHLACFEQRVGDNQVGKVIGVRDFSEVGMMNRHLMTVQAGSQQRLARLLDLLCVGFDHVDLQLALPG